VNASVSDAAAKTVRVPAGLLLAGGGANASSAQKAISRSPRSLMHLGMSVSFASGTQAFPIMTSVALTTAATASPARSPNRSADVLVMMETSS